LISSWEFDDMPISETYVLGLDVSTTASKALLVDERGSVISVASSPHELRSPRPLWSEQDPEEWWGASSTSIRSVLDEAGVKGGCVKAVGLTGQMHGLVLLDEKGDVLRPAILWNDQRTQAQCDGIHHRIGRQHFLNITGNLALTGFTAPKILWVAANEPEIYGKARHILLPKDYVRFRLTSDYAMDKADGSGTALFDLRRRTWSQEIIEALGIDPRWLPPTFEGPEVTGYVSPAAQSATGLQVGTPVVAGGGDQAAQAVGVGAVEPGVIALTVGTSGVVFAPTPGPLVEPEGRLHAFCHAMPEMWHLMGVMLSAGGSLDWYREGVVPTMSFGQLLEEAQTVPPGSEGLLFLPYLSGERTPHADPLARGAFVGLTLRHSRRHMTRAVLEGVSYGLKECLALVEGAWLNEVREVRISGGGARGSLWRQILASVLERELVCVGTTEGAAFGAALLAGVGLAIWTDVRTACAQAVKTLDVVSPDPEQSAAYRGCHELYADLYPALRPVFGRMPN
jgi:xylulokinase